MPKLDDARLILNALGLPLAQQNEAAGYTLLALAGVRECDPWAGATRTAVRIHDILQFIGGEYAKVYAENSRETIRRRVLHQFEQARIVDRNPDDPKRPTNSGLTCYALTADGLRVVRAFGKKVFSKRVEDFLERQPSLAEQHRAARQQHAVTVQLPDGVESFLSAGKHNELQAAVVHQFWPAFIATAKLLYLGDTANKSHFVDRGELERVGVPYSTHDKFPDLVFALDDRRWLVLVEAVTSHGPCSPKRRQELEHLLRDCPYRRVYVSAFPSFAGFKKHLGDIAWETEVWIAEVPDHMIHYNGPKFLGPL